MHDAESRALLRAIVLLLLVSGARWAWTLAGPGPEANGSILPELTDATTEAVADEARRSSPLGEHELIDPNRADESELDRLPGVGPSTARAIVAARDTGVVFRSASDLTAVRGIGPALAGRVKSHLDLTSVPRGRRTGPGPEAPLNLNRADVAQLQRLPGIGPALAERIVQRRRARPFSTVDELLDVRGIGQVTLERLRGRITVGNRR